MLALVYCLLSPVLASALTQDADRVSGILQQSDLNLELSDVSAQTQKDRRIMRRQFGSERFEVYEKQYPVIDVNYQEGSKLPWPQQEFHHPELHTEPLDVDPCFGQSFSSDVLDKTAVPIEHNACLNSLNLENFLIQMTVTPMQPIDSAFPHSFMPFHFSGSAKTPKDVGISMLAKTRDVGSNTSSSLKVALADGENASFYEFPLDQTPIPGYPVTYSLECSRNHDGRDCRVALNGTLQGLSHHFPVGGDVYSMNGATFGYNSGYYFRGIASYLQVCNSILGGLSQTTFTTTWVENKHTCKGREIDWYGSEKMYCDSYDCQKHGLVHINNAMKTMCRWKVYCKEEFDKERCCMEDLAWKEHELRFLYALGGILGGFTGIAICVNIFIYGRRFVLWTNRYFKVKRMFKEYDDKAFLTIPDAIDYETGLTLRAFGVKLRERSQSLSGVHEYDELWPEVVIISPLGRRKEDASGCGPGMYHSLPLVMKLLKAGIPCFTGVMVPAKDEEDAVISRSSAAESKCNILVVNHCKELYEDTRFLAAIYGAQKRNVPHIVPLSYMNGVPAKEDHWPMIAPTEFELLSMRMSVQYHFSQLSVVPEPPATILDEPKVLRQVVKFIKSTLLASYDEKLYMNNIPDAISDNVGWELRRVAQSLLRIGASREPQLAMSNFWPDVLICYSIGHRKDKDAQGYGPGMYYALALTIALIKAGIPCFSNLICRAKDDDPICTKLRSDKSKCKVFVIIKNEDLYNSQQCLKEIHAAQECRVPCIVPLSFGAAPEKDKQWESIKSTDEELLGMRKAVQKHFGKLKAVPEPPATVTESPAVLKDVLTFIEASLERERGIAKEAEKKKKAEEEEEQRRKEEEQRKMDELRMKLEREREQNEEQESEHETSSLEEPVNATDQLATVVSPHESIANVEPEPAEASEAIAFDEPVEAIAIDLPTESAMKTPEDDVKDVQPETVGDGSEVEVEEPKETPIEQTGSETLAQEVAHVEEEIMPQVGDGEVLVDEEQVDDLRGPSDDGDDDERVDDLRGPSDDDGDGGVDDLRGPSDDDGNRENVEDLRGPSDDEK